MKNLLSLAAITLAVCLIAGCGGATTSPTPSLTPTATPTSNLSPTPALSPSPSVAPGEVATYTDSLETITVRKDQEFIISLEYQYGGTYEWTETHDESMLRLVGKENKPGVNPESMFGTPATQNFRFRALKEGNVNMTFVYKRSYEVIPSKQLVFRVQIED